MEVTCPWYDLHHSGRTAAHRTRPSEYGSTRFSNDPASAIMSSFLHCQTTAVVRAASFQIIPLLHGVWGRRFHHDTVLLFELWALKTYRFISRQRRLPSFLVGILEERRGASYRAFTRFSACGVHYHVQQCRFWSSLMTSLVFKSVHLIYDRDYTAMGSLRLL